VVSFEAAAATVVSSVFLVATGQSPVIFAAVFAGGLLVSYWSYYLSLSPAQQLAEQQRTAYDLYREAFEHILSFVMINEPARWEHSQTAHHARRTQPGGSDTASTASA
jgi:hypothetical protein